ncbi:unnamed protein product [Trichobilharzia szidati]|nr:unnamed protein product [Trichobilharzia szidati]
MIFSIATLFGNSLVVLSVIRERSLRNATNWFIVSLAIADISLAILVMPLATWLEVVNGYWVFGTVICDIFIMFDVLFCTASILNLVAICLDRYLAVTKPIVYAKHNNMRRVQISIALVWIVSFLIAIPLVCGLNINTHKDPTICQSFNALYIICSSLGSFYLPAIILIVVYQRIFALIKQRHKSLRLTQTSAHHPQQPTPTPSHHHHQQNKSQSRKHQQQQTSLKQHQFNDSSTIQLTDITSSNKEQNNLKVKNKIHSKNNSDQEINLLENKYPTLTTTMTTTTAATAITLTRIDKKEPSHLIPSDYNCTISSFTQSDHEFIEEEEGITENLSDDIHFEGPRLDIPSPNLNYNLDRYILPCNQTTSIDYLKVTNQNSVPAATTLNSVDNRYNDSLIIPDRIDLKILKSFESPKYVRCSSSRSSSASSLCSPFAIEDYNEITFTCCHLEHYDSLSTENTPSRSSLGKECIVEHGEEKDRREEEQSLPNLTVHMPIGNSQLSVQTPNTPCSMIQRIPDYNVSYNNSNLSEIHKSSCQHQIPLKSSNIINLFTLPRIKTCLNCTKTHSSSISSSSDAEYSWPQISECIGQSSADAVDDDYVQVRNDSAEQNYRCTATITDSDNEEEDDDDDDVDDEEEDYDEDIHEGLLFTDENTTTICELCRNEISSKSFCVYNFNELCNCIDDYHNESIVFQYRCQPDENFCQQYINHTPNGDVYKTDLINHNKICHTRTVKVKQIKTNLSQKKKFNFRIEFCKYLSLFNDKFKQSNQIIARNLHRARKSKCFKSQNLNKRYNNHNNNSSQKTIITSNKSSRGNFSSKMDNQKTDITTIDPSPTSPVDLDSSSGKSTRKQCLNNSPKYTSTRNKNVLSQKEKKATKTLAIVLGVFLACWLPFFSINVSLGLCIYLGPDQYGFCETAGSLMSSCTWLGYVNSALNPVIYTIFNLEFRNAFKKLLHIN